MTSHAREAVADIARSWVGTPYRHHARVKGAGADCANLPVAVYSAAGLMPAIDLGVYAPDWMLHRSAERFLAVVQDWAKEIQLPGVGDLVVMRFGRTFSHGAIHVGGGQVVHAYIRAGAVVVGDLEEFKGRPMRYFTLFGVPR